MKASRVIYDAVISLGKDGASLSEITSKTGVPTATAHRWLRSAGVQLRERGDWHRGRKWTDARRLHHPCREVISEEEKEKIKLEKAINLFKSKISLPDENGCMNWRGFTMKSGYGRVNFNGKKILAHRLIWILTHGDIPNSEGHHRTLSVCHKCDNTICCNPEHLFIGTHRQNMQDMSMKGRSNKRPPMLKGEEIGGSKLTAKSVIEIRRLRALGVTTISLAKQFDVNPSVISRAANGKTWKHI